MLEEYPIDLLVRSLVHPLVHNTSLMLIIILSLLLPILATAASHFPSAIEFYHDYDKDAKCSFLSRMTLNQASIIRLAQLVANDRVDIQQEYNECCRSFTEDHAKNILNTIGNHPSLEYILGPGCLSNTIINARKNIIPMMWPPSGFPLLVDDLDLSNIDTTDITTFLKEALNQPQWWYSKEWISHVDWDKITDLGFWRMIPAGHYYWGYIYSYLVRSLSDMPSSSINHLELEHFLMKSIRIMISKDMPTSATQQPKSLVLGVNGLLTKFAHLNDPWSTKVIELLTIFYENDLKPAALPSVLVRSQLLEFDHWQELIKDKHITKTTATNDILELFTIAFLSDPQDGQMNEIIPFLNAFLATQDWSLLRPVVIIQAINATKNKLGYAFFAPYLDKLPNDPKVLSRLPPEWFSGPRGLLATKYQLNKSVKPLMEGFKHGSNIIRRNPYTFLLHQEWNRDKTNWPGLLAAHQRYMHALPFILSTIDLGTYDPDLSGTNPQRTWDLSFALIGFEVEHGIPGTVVPSICFLQALRYLHKNSSVNWTEFEKEADKKCDFPKTTSRQNHYLRALTAANNFLFMHLPLLSKLDLKLLQAVIRGDSQDAADTLTRGMAQLALSG